MQDDMNPDDLSPAECDDAELILIRTRLRMQIARNLGNVSPELTERYRAFNEEVDKRRRGEWS